jgi:hypothetical protein
VNVKKPTENNKKTCLANTKTTLCFRKQKSVFFVFSIMEKNKKARKVENKKHLGEVFFVF